VYTYVPREREKERWIPTRMHTRTATTERGCMQTLSSIDKHDLPPPFPMLVAHMFAGVGLLVQVLIPVFALGRAQELCILLDTYWERMNLTVPIYFSAGAGRPTPSLTLSHTHRYIYIYAYIHPTWLTSTDNLVCRSYNACSTWKRTAARVFMKVYVCVCVALSVSVPLCVLTGECEWASRADGEGKPLLQTVY
jgi:hypothetical protein